MQFAQQFSIPGKRLENRGIPLSCESNDPPKEVTLQKYQLKFTGVSKSRKYQFLKTSFPFGKNCGYDRYKKVCQTFLMIVMIFDIPT